MKRAETESLMGNWPRRAVCARSRRDRIFRSNSDLLCHLASTWGSAACAGLGVARVTHPTPLSPALCLRKGLSSFYCHYDPVHYASVPPSPWGVNELSFTLALPASCRLASQSPSQQDGQR